MTRRSIRAAIIIYMVAEFFLSPGFGLVQTNAQSSPLPVPGDPWPSEFLNSTNYPQSLIVDQLGRNRLSINPDGSLNMVPAVKSTPGGTGAVTVTSSSTTIIPASARKFLAIDNESTTATIACSFGGTAAINTAGSWTIMSGMTRIWNSAWVPSDAVNCISSAATSAATFQVN